MKKSSSTSQKTHPRLFLNFSILLLILCSLPACAMLSSPESRLITSIQNYDVATAEKLITSTYDLNFITESDTFPLLEAAYAGNLQLVQLLTGYRANIDLQNSKGLTALMAAVYYDHRDIFEYLIFEGADLSLKNHRHYSALHFAVDQGNQEYIDILMDRTPAEAYTGAESVSLLRPAIENNDVATVSYLLDKKISPATPPGQGMSPLITAAVSPNPDIVKLLLEHGADVHAKDADGCDALWLVGSLDIPLIMEKIYTLADPVFFNADPTGRVVSDSEKTKIGLTTLVKTLEAAMDSSDPTVRTTKAKELMETYDYGFLFAPISDDRIETLALKLKSDYVRTIDHLLTAGADINTADKRDRTVLNILCSRKTKNIPALFSNAEFALPPDALARLSLVSDHAETIHAEIIKPFMAATDVNQRDAYGNTPLLLSCGKNTHHLAPALIQNGANINTANDDGWTPLITAAYAGKLDIARLLLENSAHVNAANKYGETALLKAVYNNDAPMVKLLLEYGADIHKANQRGESPLGVAEKHGYQEILVLFKK